MTTNFLSFDASVFIISCGFAKLTGSHVKYLQMCVHFIFLMEIVNSEILLD